MTTDGSPRRGRPPATSRTEIARVAVRLFTRQGYDATTLDQVAEVVGINRSTLFRYFDSKNAIVWEGAAESQAAFVATLAAIPDDGPWVGPLVDALAATPLTPDGDVEFLRMQLRLIGSVPVLRSQLLAATEPVVTAMTAYIARRRAEPPTALVPLSLARVAWAAAVSGLMWWAETGEGDPRQAVRLALAAVEQFRT